MQDGSPLGEYEHQPSFEVTGARSRAVLVGTGRG